MRSEASAATLRMTTRSRPPARAMRSAPARRGCGGRQGRHTSPLVAVGVQAKLRRDKGHAARLWMADRRQNEVARVARGAHGPAGYRELHLGQPGARCAAVRREPRLPGQKPVPAVRPRQDMGAKRSAEGCRLLGSELHDPRWNAARRRLASGHGERARSGQRFRQRHRATGCERGRRASRKRGWELRHDPGLPPTRRAFRSARVNPCSSMARARPSRPFTTVKTAWRSAQSTSPATVPASARICGSTTRRRDWHSGAPRTPPIPS